MVSIIIVVMNVLGANVLEMREISQTLLLPLIMIQCLYRYMHI